jgi:hypothetical protein
MQRFPTFPVLTPFHMLSLGPAISGGNQTFSTGAISGTWPANDLALFYPFTLYDWATAYQLLFWVGATSSGNIDVGIYDSQGHRIVSSGSTAMSATVNTVQELNIADTVLPPGDYFIGVVCSTTAGTVFRALSTDEVALPNYPVYEQASALPLPSTATPVLSTQASPIVAVCGIQFRPTF